MRTILINEIKEVKEEIKQYGDNAQYAEVSRAFNSAKVGEQVTIITGKTNEGEEKRAVYKKVSDTEVVKVDTYLYS